jgi:hypothetical protein
LSEKIVLKFADGASFEWNTSSIKDAKFAMDMRKKYGDPVAIIGEGKVAKLLREKYEMYKVDPEHYKTHVFGTASEFSGVAANKVEKDFRKATNRLKFWKRH